MLTASRDRLPHRLPHRLGAWLRGGLSALLLCCIPQTATAEEEPKTPEIPAGATYFLGMPPLVPKDHKDKAAVAVLADELIAWGRLERGRRRGGDMLFSAAHARYHHLDQPKPAFELFTEAAAAYPAGDPTAAVVLFFHARRENWRGNHAAATKLLETFAGWLDVRPPADQDRADELRWAALWDVAHKDLPRLQADLQEANGKFAEAADSLARLLADQAVSLRADQRISLFERIARLRYRAKDKDGAVQAIDEALLESPDERSSAGLNFWRLYAKHGLLAADGAPGLTSTWPGEAFENDLRVYLRTLQDVPGLGTSYLALASSAFTARKKELALEIYLLALRDPGLVESARGDEDIWRGLLMAFPAALELERFEEAERLLDVVERIADVASPEMDDYRIAVREGRAQKQERLARAAEEKRRREAGPEESDPRLEPGRKPAGIETGDRPGTGDDLHDDPEGEGEDRLLTLLLTAAGGLLLVGVLLLRRRK